MGGVLCRPLSRHWCRDQSRKPWRERPRCARWKWPRACPEGSLTPWLPVSLSTVSVGLVCSQARAESAHKWARIDTRIARTIRSCSSRTVGSASAFVTSHDSESNVWADRARMDTQSEPSLAHGEGCVRDHCQGVGHHAIDGRSVLGTGKALRVASTAHSHPNAAAALGAPG